MTHMTEPTIDIIIPAYNEEHRIEPMLRSYVDYFDVDVQFIVVLNGCRDNTLAVVERVQKKHPQAITIINIPEAIGKGGAIIAGWNASIARWIGFVDADGSTSPAEFEKLIQTALAGKGGTDREGRTYPRAVIASRFMPGGQVIDRHSFMRKVSSRGFAWGVRRLFGMGYYDTQCGAKLFSRSTILPMLANVKTTDMNFDVELLWRLYQQGIVVQEVPTIWIDKPGSVALGTRSDFLSTGFKMAWRLLKLRLWKA